MTYPTSFAVPLKKNEEIMETIYSKHCKKCNRKLTVKDIRVIKLEINSPKSLKSSCCNAPVVVEED